MVRYIRQYTLNEKQAKTLSSPSPGASPASKGQTIDKVPIAGYYNNERWLNPNYNGNLKVETAQTALCNEPVTKQQVEKADRQYATSQKKTNYLNLFNRAVQPNMAKPVTASDRMYVMDRKIKRPYTATTTMCAACNTTGPAAQPCPVRCYMEVCNKCGYYGHAARLCHQAPPMPSR